MKNRLLNAMTISSLLFVSSFALAINLEVDPNHSSVVFEATHLKVSKVPGKFGEFSGVLDLNEQDITKSNINFTVNVGSINTNVLQRDDHLRSPEFFDAKKYPKATFKSTAIRKSGQDFKVEGDLTIKNVTKKVVMDAKNLGKVNDPVMKTDKYVFTGSTEINRKDFGVSYGPDSLVADKVRLWVNLEAMPKKANQPTPNEAPAGQTEGGQVGK